MVTFAGFPHVEKLEFAIGAVAKGGVGQPDRVSIDAVQHREMIVLAVFEVYQHGYLEFGQLPVAGGEALRLEAELGQGALHVLEAGAKVAFIHGIEQFLFRDFLAIEFVQDGCQGRSAAGVIQVLLDDAGIAEGFPAFDGHVAGE